MLPAAMLAPAALTADLQALRAAVTGAVQRQLLFATGRRYPTPRASAGGLAGALLRRSRPGSRRPCWWRRLIAVQRCYKPMLEPLRPAVVSCHGPPAPALIDRVKRWGSLIVSSGHHGRRRLLWRCTQLDLGPTRHRQGWKPAAIATTSSPTTSSRPWRVAGALRLPGAPWRPVLAAGAVADAAAVLGCTPAGAACRWAGHHSPDARSHHLEGARSTLTGGAPTWR